MAAYFGGFQAKRPERQTDTKHGILQVSKKSLVSVLSSPRFNQRRGAVTGDEIIAGEYIIRDQPAPRQSTSNVVDSSNFSGDILSSSNACLRSASTPASPKLESIRSSVRRFVSRLYRSQASPQQGNPDSHSNALLFDSAHVEAMGSHLDESSKHSRNQSLEPPQPSNPRSSGSFEIDKGVIVEKKDPKVPKVRMVGCVASSEQVETEQLAKERLRSEFRKVLCCYCFCCKAPSQNTTKAKRKRHEKISTDIIKSHRKQAKINRSRATSTYSYWGSGYSNRCTKVDF